MSFNISQKLQTWFAEHTSIGTFGDNLERALFQRNDMPAPRVPDATGKLPILRKAPEEFIGGGQWFNGGPRKLSDLRGKVVLIDFWTYSCINCIRTLPYVQAYWDKYKSEPFMLIGVHTPEFTFEKSAANVRMAILEHELRYPNVQDNDFKIWNSFNNRYWPAKYLIDAEGNIRYEHFGEGHYDETDRAIASLLAEIGSSATGSVVAAPALQNPYRDITPETYLSSRSWGALGNTTSGPTDDVATYAAPSSMDLHRYYLAGEWKLIDDERQVLRSSEGEIRIRALGGEVNLVLGLENGVKYVKADVEVDGKLTETITIDRHDLYNLYKGPYGEHEVILKLKNRGVAAYAFTFGQ